MSDSTPSLTITSEATDLPWAALRHTEGDIPWTALEEFAESLTAEPELWPKLAEVYDAYAGGTGPCPSYEWLYVPAIFAMAGPRLDEAVRRRIAEYLIGQLIEAGVRDDDLELEVLEIACGSLGPTVLEPALDALERMSRDDGAWFYLWSLASLATQTDDAALRRRVVKSLQQQLQAAIDGQEDIDLVVGTVRTFVLLAGEESRPLIERLRQCNRQRKGFLYESNNATFREALAYLDGREPCKYRHRPWHEPVQEWVSRFWRFAQSVRELGDKDHRERTEIEDAPDEDPEMVRARMLAERFTRSSAAKVLPDEMQANAQALAEIVLGHAWTDGGVRPEELDEESLGFVLRDMIPRNYAVDRTALEQVAPVTQALLGWLESEGVLADARALAEQVGRWAPSIVGLGMDPRNWSLTKIMMMIAAKSGVDICDREQVENFVVDFSHRLSDATTADRFDAQDESEGWDEPVTAPIVNEGARVGRNDPCPCGSGRKYKKCCGE